MHTIHVYCNKFCDPISHSEARDCGKWGEIVDLQLTNQIPTLPYNTLQYLPLNIYITVLIIVTNTVIWLVTQRSEAVASEVK